MLYKCAWTPVIKCTHSLITNLTFWELWLTWASETLLQVTTHGFKLTCINRGETNWRDSGLHGKVTLVPNSSYLFSVGTYLFAFLYLLTPFLMGYCEKNLMARDRIPIPFINQRPSSWFLFYLYLYFILLSLPIIITNKSLYFY